MAFKFTVDYKQLRLIIQTDSTESVSLFEHLKSTVDFIDLQQIVAFQQLTAANVNIDADTLNRYFTEQYNSPNAESFGFSDAQALAPSLVKADSSVISEILAKDLDKALADAPTLTEELSRVVQYVRDFTDAPALSEAITSLDTALGKEDTTSVTEELAKLFETSFSDAPTVTEELVQDVGLAKADTPTLTDSEVLDTSLAKDDSTSVTEDLASLFSAAKADTTSLSESDAKEVGKAADNDTVSVAESFDRNVTFLRTFADAAALDDAASATDELATQSDLVKNNVFGFTDSEAKDFSKPGITDSPSLSEDLSYLAGLAPSDTLGASDAAPVFSTSLTRADTTSLSEDLSIASTNALADAFSITESSSFSLASSAADTLAITEVLTHEFGLSSSDAVSVAESLVQSFGKTATDSATITESISILFIPGGGSILNTAALNTFVLN